MQIKPYKNIGGVLDDKSTKLTCRFYCSFLLQSRVPQPSVLQSSHLSFFQARTNHPAYSVLICPRSCQSTVPCGVRGLRRLISLLSPVSHLISLVLTEANSNGTSQKDPGPLGPAEQRHGGSAMPASPRRTRRFSTTNARITDVGRLAVTKRAEDWGVCRP